MGLRGVHAGERGHAPLLRGVREHEAAAGRRGAAEGRRGASGRRGAGLGGAEGRGVVTCVVRHGDARRHPQVRRPQPLRRVGHPDDGPLRRRQALDHQLQDEDQAEPVGQSGGPDRRRRFGDARAARRAPRPDGRARHGAPRHAASLRRQALQVPDHRRLGPRGHGRSGCARRRDGVAAGEHRQRGHARHRRRSLVRRRRRGHDPTRHPRRRRREPHRRGHGALRVGAAARRVGVQFRHRRLFRVERAHAAAGAGARRVFAERGRRAQRRHAVAHGRRPDCDDHVEAARADARREPRGDELRRVRRSAGRPARGCARALAAPLEDV
mmetsp:Transcript_19601/g.67322  ORF Transcript_19601/g.67322 Transcript_19601/m.67322 type:complete len:326 (+) Transcript_19601:68-1045(+)